jgi:hypothetical protein
MSPSGAAGDQETAAAVSPALRIQPALQPPTQLHSGDLDLGIRSIDGAWNNIADPSMGAAFTPLERWLDPDYADKIETFAGPTRPGARAISNALSAQDHSVPDTARASDLLWQWGQFLDHDIDLTDGVYPPEWADIAVPDDDQYFAPGGIIPFNRSAWDPSSGSDQQNPRQQLNQITGWIDASNVYGSDEIRADALRELDGTGHLRVSDGDLLPWNTDGLANAGGPSPSLFLAGDVRANEQVGLTAMHTLFVREHNRLADLIGDANPGWTGDQIYQEARLLVGAQMQVITYEEFLPILLGPHAIEHYQGYDPTANGRILNVFSAAAYRFGHSTLSATLLRLDADGDEIAHGHLALPDAFFAPDRIVLEGGIEPLLRGLASQVCQAVDPYIVDEVRNFLFGDPDDGGFDLAALNIQRGRDHGLPSYNDARIGVGLEPAASFADVSLNPDIQARLSEIYDDVNEIDLWVGGLSEDPVPRAMLGELFHTIVSRQFTILRDGDRFWYQNVLTKKEIKDIRKTRLADIIRRNTAINSEIDDDVFLVEKRGRKKKR